MISTATTQDTQTELKRKVALACRIVAMQGLVRETTGHVSARIPGTERMLIRARGRDETGLLFTSAAEILETDFDGSDMPDDAPLGKPQELPIHGESYKTRPAVMSVVHAHPLAILLCGIQVDAPEPRRPNSSSIHHAFLLTMDEYHAAQERFRAAGYDVADTREAFRARGEYSMDINDPDDHRWQVQAYSDEAHEIIKPGVGVVDCGPADHFEVGSVTTFREDNFFIVRDREGFCALSCWCRHILEAFDDPPAIVSARLAHVRHPVLDRWPAGLGTGSDNRHVAC